MLTIYTDGSSLGNPGNGGWAAIIKDDKNNIIELSGGFKHTTNNRMELYSVIESLKFAHKNKETTISIFTDSQLICNSINKGWLYKWTKNNWRKSNGTKVLNIDLWDTLNSLLVGLNVSFIWIAGHNGIEGNERCDMLCKKAAEQATLEDTVYINTINSQNNIDFSNNNLSNNTTSNSNIKHSTEKKYKYTSKCGNYILYVNKEKKIANIYNKDNINKILIEFNL